MLGIAETEATRLLGCDMAPALREPADARELAALLDAARTACQSVVPWGGGTEQQLGPCPRRVDLLLKTGALSGVLAYTPEDLTLSVRAGTSLAAINQVLNVRGQALPLDIPSPERATIGGVVASAPPPVRRLKYGGVRDQVIGLEFALADGSLRKSGGRVVKNVAGYDLCKLLTGSLGTLAVITLVHLKVQPAPREQRILRCAFARPAAALGAAAILAASGLGFGALIVTQEGTQSASSLTVVLEGFAGAVRAQERAARAAIVQADGDLVASEEDARVAIAGLAEWRSSARHEGAVLLRGAVAPGKLDAAHAALADALPAHLGLQIDAGTGTFWAWLAGADPDLASSIGAVRDRLRHIHGHMIIAAGAPAVRAACDPWDPPADGAGLARALKTEFDPAGILNPGRFAYGI